MLASGVVDDPALRECISGQIGTLYADDGGSGECSYSDETQVLRVEQQR